MTLVANRSRWVNYAACLWAALFAAPHIWWALGFPAGFPGGVANHRLMMTTWLFLRPVGCPLERHRHSACSCASPAIGPRHSPLGPSHCGVDCVWNAYSARRGRNGC